MSEKKYIDADALISECEEEIVDYDEDLQKHFIVKAVPTEYIEAFPTADVEEVRHGQWLRRFGTIICSECEEKALYEYNENVNEDLHYLLPMRSKRCPACGAKMDEVKNEISVEICINKHTS